MRAILLILAACGGSSETPDAAEPDAPPDVAIDIDAALPRTSVDCASGCTTLNIAGDPPAAGKFHGYADPAMRRDPATNRLVMAYSYPRFLTDGTINVELHLAHSVDDGTSWTADGPLFTSRMVGTNHSSDEVIDILPIQTASGAVWVQAHLDYLVPVGSKETYTQLHTTGYIALSAATSLAQLGAAPEARLGAKTTDPALGITTNLSSLDHDGCTAWGQTALAFSNNTLYLGVQCLESPSAGDGKNATQLVFATTPTGLDARTWVWHYAGVIGTPAQAALVDPADGAMLFTELEFTHDKAGAPLAIINVAKPSTGVQPIVQFGCRAIPLASFEPPAFVMENGVPKVIGSVTISDLYTGSNQGTGACTYEPTSKTGIVIVRKLSADPTLGFFVSLQASGLTP